VARLSLRRWRCWWQAPYGHVDELTEYMDALSGRWTARIRCARCGRESRALIGHAGDRGVLARNPMTLLLPRQGGRSLPPRKSAAVGPQGNARGAVFLELPDGTRADIRAVQAHLPLGRRRIVYVAETAGAVPTVSGELRTALARACPDAQDDWLDRTARQLEAELPAGS
jgi:hypothetical protein